MEAPEIGQNEEIADPSDEGNSDTEGDDISSENPADEDPVEEEPSEGDVEEVEEPTIGLMGDDDDPPATDNTVSVTLPATQQGYAITDAAETATKGTDYTFKVTANDNWRIDAVTYEVAESEDGEKTLPAGEDNVTYTIKGTEITNDITIDVKAVQTVTVTVKAPATVTVKCAVGEGADQDVKSETPVTVDKGAKVKLTVTPIDATYDVTVKKGSAVIEDEDKDNVYNLGEITANATYTVTATKNRYMITEAINQITVTEGEEGNTTTKEIPSAKIVYTTDDYKEVESDGVKTQMITQKKALKFKLEYADALKDKEDLKVVVSYKVGATGKETPLNNADKDGVYTIAANLVKDDIALDVDVHEYQTFAVTMAPDTNVEKIERVDGTDVVEFTKGEDGKYASLDVTEDTVLNFKVTPKKYYKIKEVKAGNEALKADTKGVYTWTVAKAETITVATELDSAQQGSLTFKVTGDAKSASAAFTDPISGAKTVEAGETVKLAAVKDDELILTITPKDGYIIKSVTGATAVPVDTQADTDTGVKQYMVKFPATRTATVTVTTDADESTKESKVTFVEDGSVSHMSYNVQTGSAAKVTKDEGGDGKYTVAEGAKKLAFSITVTGSYKPTVKMSGEDKPENGDDEGKQDEKTREASTPIEIDPAKVTTTKTGATYDYVIPATQLKDDNTLTISESPDYRDIALDVSQSQNVNIVASVDGTKIGEWKGSDHCKVLLNTVVTFQITAQKNTSLTDVFSWIQSDEAKKTHAKITNNTATVELKVTDNAEIEIVAEDQYVASALMENGNALKPEKNSYNVAYNGTYTATVVKGKDETVAALSEVKVLLGNNLVADAANDKKVGSYTGNTATIDLKNVADVTAIVGKTLTVELYAKDGEAADAPSVKAATYSLNVSIPAKDIKIDKKDKLTATQAIDTTKTYTVTAAKGVDLNKLVAEVTADDSGIIATTADNSNGGDEKATTKLVTYANGKLTVTMAAQKVPETNATATITIKEQGATGDDAPKATLTITAAELINSNTTAPTVKMVAATDVAFKLTLSAKTAQTANGKLYYKVESTEKVEGATTKATYVEKTGDSQTAMVTVSDASKVANYEVKATLVHLDKAVTNETTLADGTVTLSTSKTSNAQTLKTQTPAYEDKLKLKKGKTTIVTGEKDIVIAEPQYNKYTTFLSLAQTGAVKDITSNLGDGEALDVDVITVGVDQKITATATDKTKIGKHRIQVTASAENGAYASVATIDVTVVRGIHKLNVTVPSTNLYKANKKPAKVKATVVYNQGMDSSAPKNKNVTWEIVGSDYIKKMVTVKNGTVTVDKNFIVDTVEANNQFKIKVTANNDKSFAGGEYKTVDGKEVLVPFTGESPVITITGQGEDIKTLAIVKVGAENKEYIKALSGSDEGVPASDIHEGKVVVLNSKASGLKIGDEYTDAIKENAIKLSLLTLKSSNQKSVPVDANGEIKVNKVAKVKLTATAKDGSNKKAELSLNIINDGTEGDLGLSMYEAQYDKSGQPQAKTPAASVYDFTTATTTAINHDFSETPVVQLKVQQKVTPENGAATYSDVPDFANFSLTVQGGKIVQQNGSEAFVAINAKTVTVKLTNKAKKSDNVVTYTLTNNGAAETPTFTVKNKLQSKGLAGEQIANIEVSKLTDAVPKTDLVAKVAVDWSAKNTKNADDLNYLAGKLKDKYELEEINDGKGTFTLELTGGDKELITLNQKSYKLTVTLYAKKAAAEVAADVDADTNATYTAVTAPKTITVSVDSAKKFTFKPATSYTLKTKDVKASAELTGKASGTNDYTVTWETTLQNLNTKGKTNKFAEYFKIEDVNGKPSIKLAKLNNGELPDTADRTGYITYTATTTMSNYNPTTVTGTVKITIKFDDNKPLATYSQQKVNNKLPEIFLTTGSETTTSIEAKVGKGTAELVKLSYVTVDYKDNTSKDFAVEKASGDGALKLTYNGNGLKKNTTYKVKLFIVPEGSYYKAIIDELASSQGNVSNLSPEENKVTLAIAKYGIPVTVQVKAIEAPSAEEKNYTVTITEGPATVAQGGEATYTAEVKEDGTKLDDATVTWKVEAESGSTLADGTTIDVNSGKLTVVAGQAKDSVLLITATYTPEGGTPVPSEAKEVTVTEAAGGGGGV